MLAGIKFLRILCLVLLMLSVIITTIWIIELNFPAEEVSEINTQHLQWISWYVTAPLVVIYATIKLIEFLVRQ